MKMISAVAAMTLAFAVAVQAQDAVPQPGAFSDPEAVEVIQAANEGEITAAELALQKATRTDVKKYAARMKRDHDASKSKMQALASDKGWTAAESEFSGTLRRHSQEMNGSLSPLSGADFDRAYIDGMVADHQALLDALDQRLIPNAQDSTLRAELRKKRAVVNEHLREARRIQGRIAGGKDNSGNDGERAVGPQEGRYPEAGRYRDASKMEEPTQP